MTAFTTAGQKSPLTNGASCDAGAFFGAGAGLTGFCRGTGARRNGSGARSKGGRSSSAGRGAGSCMGSDAGLGAGEEISAFGAEKAAPLPTSASSRSSRAASPLAVPSKDSSHRRMRQTSASVRRLPLRGRSAAVFCKRASMERSRWGPNWAERPRMVASS